MAGLMIGLSCRNNSLLPFDIVPICEKNVIKVLILGEKKIGFTLGEQNKILVRNVLYNKCQKGVPERGAGSTIFPFRNAEKGGLKCVIP